MLLQHMENKCASRVDAATIPGSGFRVRVLGFRVVGSGFRVRDLVCRVLGSGLGG